MCKLLYQMHDSSDSGLQSDIHAPAERLLYFYVVRGRSASENL